MSLNSLNLATVGYRIGYSPVEPQRQPVGCRLDPTTNGKAMAVDVLSKRLIEPKINRQNKSQKFPVSPQLCPILVSWRHQAPRLRRSRCRLWPSSSSAMRSPSRPLAPPRCWTAGATRSTAFSTAANFKASTSAAAVTLGNGSQSFPSWSSSRAAALRTTTDLRRLRLLQLPAPSADLRLRCSNNGRRDASDVGLGGQHGF